MPYLSDGCRIHSAAVARAPGTHYYKFSERASSAWASPAWFCLGNSTLSGISLLCKPFRLDCRVTRIMIDFYNNNGEICIEAVGDIARNGDWEEGRILSEKDMIFGDYDIQKREWNFWVAH